MSRVSPVTPNSAVARRAYRYGATRSSDGTQTTTLAQISLGRRESQVSQDASANPCWFAFTVARDLNDLLGNQFLDGIGVVRGPKKLQGRFISGRHPFDIFGTERRLPQQIIDRDDLVHPLMAQVEVIAASDHARLHMSALAALVGAKIGLIGARDAFETDKPRRLGAQFTCRTVQSGRALALGGSAGEARLEVLFHEFEYGREHRRRQSKKSNYCCLFNDLQ